MNNTACPPPAVILVPALFYTLALNEMIAIVAMFFLTTYKLYHGTYTLRRQPILIVYFIILYIGIILRIATNSVTFSDPEKFLQNAQKVNTLFALSTICYETFYSLMPNMFFSITQTKLTKVKRGEMRPYWLVNIVLTSIFVLLTIILVFVPTDPALGLWPTNIIQLLEITYTFGFYIFVLANLSKKDHPEVFEKLKSFFIDYSFFGMINIVCACFRGTFPNSGLEEGIAAHQMQETILLVTFYSSMSKIHLKSHAGQKTKRSEGKDTSSPHVSENATEL